MRLIGDIDPGRPLVVLAVAEEARYLPADLPVLLTGMGKVNAASAVAAVLARGPRPPWCQPGHGRGVAPRVGRA